MLERSHIGKALVFSSSMVLGLDVAEADELQVSQEKVDYATSLVDEVCSAKDYFQPEKFQWSKYDDAVVDSIIAEGQTLQDLISASESRVKAFCTPPELTTMENVDRVKTDTDTK